MAQIEQMYADLVKLFEDLTGIVFFLPLILPNKGC